MSDVVFRHFYVDGGPLAELIHKMRDHRQQAFAELSKLANSLGARQGVFKGNTVYGFIFKKEPRPEHWKLLSYTADRRAIYGPIRRTKKGQHAAEEMSKITIPDYQSAIEHTPFVDNIIFGDNDCCLYRPTLGFIKDRVFVVVPYASESFIAFMKREDDEATAQGYEGGAGRANYPRYDAPVPEGWTEWKEWEMKKYMDDFETAQKAGAAATSETPQ